MPYCLCQSGPTAFTSVLSAACNKPAEHGVHACIHGSYRWPPNRIHMSHCALSCTHPASQPAMGFMHACMDPIDHPKIESTCPIVLSAARTQPAGHGVGVDVRWVAVALLRRGLREVRVVQPPVRWLVPLDDRTDAGVCAAQEPHRLHAREDLRGAPRALDVGFLEPKQWHHVTPPARSRRSARCTPGFGFRVFIP
jgi:hypothetical protein